VNDAGNPFDPIPEMKERSRRPANEPADAPPVGDGPAATATADRSILAWRRGDAFLEGASEWLNPILVKEARQALKSKQFAITFALVLVCGWGWSLLGLAILGPVGEYVAGGPVMLTGYFWVLAFPLLIIVPFMAFRSLAVEREDGTYELLAITALSARQTIGGKLASSVLQMMIYFSALAPCVAFTYLLRGVDVLLIGLLLGYTLLGSVALSMLAMLLATATRVRHWQVVLSVFVILGLFLLYFGVGSSVMGMLAMGQAIPYDDLEFWMAHATILTVGVSYFVLCYLSAAAAISFASENRATRLRWVLLLQQAAALGWAMWWYLDSGDIEVFFVASSMMALHWGVIGSLTSGESPQLSPRAKRSLPHSFLGRVFLTWLNPGPNTGYLFVVGAYGSAVVVMVAVPLFGQLLGDAFAVPIAPARFADSWLFVALTWCYLAIYLGIGRAAVGLFSRIVPIDLLKSFLIHVVILVAGVGFPFFVQRFFLQIYEYTPLQMPNPFWTLGEVVDDNIGNLVTPGGAILSLGVPIVLGMGAAAIFIVSLAAAFRDATYVHEDAPDRVREDETEPKAAPAAAN
jgi:hypothetical protein